MQEQEKNTNKKSDAAFREEKVLEFWKEKKIFEKSLEKNSPKGEFVFFDGPVTSNSKPVLHTMVPFTFKDVIPRYKTMRGYHVRRKGGWDTHGLPVELQIEKKLGFKSKNDIEEYGIVAFNKLCKDSVWEYIGLWKNFTKRMGYWADQENPYVTYENNYIESVWNIVKRVQEQSLLYKDYKVVPWCPRCGTALSSHELAQGYEDVKDLSVYVKFKIVGQENKYILAWTTTPWTLPGNVALAVGEDIDYVEAKVGSEIFVLAKERLALIESEYEIIAEHKGSELVGLEYEALFPFLKEQIEDKKEATDKMYKVYSADFVNTEDGTGIVHTAVMYGQDDFVLGTEVGLPKHHLVNPEGNFVKGTGFLEGRFVRETNTDGKPTLAVDIIDDLKKRNLFFKQENYKHSYPHCWRCHTALIYYARDSWYIRMSDPKIKAQLISENQKINWEPAYTRDGRFGEWLREIKDWAISRERYWGTPLPVWQCESCKQIEVIGSIEDLKNKTKKSGNKYYLIRHGQARNNVEKIFHKDSENHEELTEEGLKQLHGNAIKLDGTIDIVFSSPFERTKETAEIVCEKIKYPFDKVVFDRRIEEWQVDSEYNGKTHGEVMKEYDEDYVYYPQKKYNDGENFAQATKRIGDFIYEIESKYQNKNILIVGHGGIFKALSFLTKGFTFQDLPALNKDFPNFKNGEMRKLEFIPVPHNENYELDLHRPFIDEVKLECKCGGSLTRTKEVMDVWFDSGAMPFAQDHYPFDVKEPLYPADYISEAIDQTRGWFYTLHAVGALMGRGMAYKNVICLGHLLDAKGKKMSKSIGNVVDPFEAIDKYGVDALRLWMYSVNQPGESKNFDEKTVSLVSAQIFGLLYNVLAFYELYRDKSLETNERPQSKNILDQWILARLDELVELMTKNLDNYKLLEPVRATRDFIGDLSTWYLRRSRDRIKDNDVEAKQTLYFVLKTLAKLMAPFAPFTADDIWLKLRLENDTESAHLSDWPKVKKSIFGIFSSGKPKVLEEMAKVRESVSNLLKERQQKNIPVKQPLKEATGLSVREEYIEIIKEEVNVKNYQGTGVFSLDTDISGELKEEGDYRELVRSLQDMRKKMGLIPSDAVSISFETNDDGKKLIQKFENDMKKVVMVSDIKFEQNEGTEIKIGVLVFKVRIDKI